MTLSLCVVFFVSGIAALLFETLWFYQTALVLGNSIWASSLVLASFMGGLAIGNGLVVQVGHKVQQPVRVYALLEVIVGVTGAAIVYGLPLLTPLLTRALRPFLDSPGMLNCLRFSVAFPLLLIPSTAMGMTLPLLVAALVRKHFLFGRVLGLLYGWNTLGAVIGAMAGEMALIVWLGIRGTAVVALLFNCCAAFIATILSGWNDAKALDPYQETAAPLTHRAIHVLAAAGVSGGILLALEVVWFRLLLLFVHASSLAFAVMLSVILAGIGLGGLLGSRWLAYRPDVHRYLPILAMSSGVACINTYALFDVVARHPIQGLSAYRLDEMLALSLPLMFPVSLLSGLLFTWLGESLKQETNEGMRTAGFLTLANTIGAMLGSLAAGFLLLPILGVERSIRLLGGCYGIVAAFLSFDVIRQFARRELTIFCIAAGAFVVAYVKFPSGFMLERYLPYRIGVVHAFYGSMPVETREGLTETIVYLRREVFGEPVDYELFTNSFVMTDTTLISRRYTELYVYLPVAIHPVPTHALLIGYGLGTTAKALQDTASLETIDVVDPSPDILSMSRVVYPEPKDNPLNDPRVRVHVEDGRYFLQTTSRLFDLITGDPPPPKNAGIVNLYTREYFGLARDRLAEGGMMTYWMPSHAVSEVEAKTIIRAFCSVFTDCSLWNGGGLQWILMGTRNATGPISEERFTAQWRDQVVGPELKAIGVEVPEQLGALFMGDANYLEKMTRDVEPLTDDYPKRLSPGFAPVTPKDWHAEWIDVHAARDRFIHSQIIARLWPDSLRTTTLPYFETQERINRYFMHELPSAAATLEMAHNALSHSTLHALPMWLLGSDANVQRAVQHAFAQGRHHQYLNYHLSVSAMAERHYQLANEVLSSEPEQDLSRRGSLCYRLYVMCMAGRVTDAQTLAAYFSFPNTQSQDDLRFVKFLSETFGFVGVKQN